MNVRHLATLSLLTLAACELEGTPLARDLGLQQRVISYYDDRAIENGANCPTAQMDTIVHAQVLEDTPSQTVMRLRYHFTDQGQGANWGLRPATAATTGASAPSPSPSAATATSRWSPCPGRSGRLVGGEGRPLRSPMTRTGPGVPQTYRPRQAIPPVI